MRRHSPLISLFAALLISGCSTANVRPPQVSLQDLRLGEMTILETTLIASLRLENTGPDPITIDGASFRLLLNDWDVGRGSSGDRITIPRFGSAVQRAEFRLDNLYLLSRIQPLIESHDFSYRLEGELYLEGGWGFGRSIDFSRSGRFDLDGADFRRGERRPE